MFKEIENSQFIKITASSPLYSVEYQKISIRPVVIKGENCYQAERFKQNQVFHLNLKEKEFNSWCTRCYRTTCDNESLHDGASCCWKDNHLDCYLP